MSEITYTATTLSSIESEVVYTKDAAADVSGWSVIADPMGSIVSKYDHFIPNYTTTSMHSVIVNDGYVKGIGLVVESPTQFHDARLPRFLACREAMLLNIIHSIYPDAPIAHAVMQIPNQTAIIDWRHIDDTDEWQLIDQVPVEQRTDMRGLLVKDMPIRLAHLPAMTGTWQEKLAYCKQQYELTNVADDIFRAHMFESIITRLSYWFFRRFQFGSISSASVDIFGNVVSLTKTEIKPDFRNTYICAEQLLLWESSDFYYHVAAFLADNLMAGDVNIDGEQTEEEIAQTIAHSAANALFQQQCIARIPFIMQKQAIQLLGLTAHEVNLLHHASPALADKLGFAIIEYLRHNTDVQGVAANYLHVDTPLVGNDFRDDFTRIVSGHGGVSMQADNIQHYFNQISNYIPTRYAVWAENCRKVNADISEINIQPDFGKNLDKTEMMAKIDRGITIFAMTQGAIK